MNRMLITLLGSVCAERAPLKPWNYTLINSRIAGANKSVQLN